VGSTDAKAKRREREGSIREGAQNHGESDGKSSAGALHVMQYCPGESRCLQRREYRAIIKFVRLGTGLRYEECFGGLRCEGDHIAWGWRRRGSIVDAMMKLVKDIAWED
jgi:hypothetical protein